MCSASLVEAELLYQRGRPPRSRYMFKHALIQDAAYQSLVRRTRQQYHRQVAELLESNFADTVEASPEFVAHHYSEAGLPAPAVTYWLRAGENATRRSANQEAIGHLTAGLAQLAQLPEAPERAKRELALQRLLGQASFATRGYASPEATRAFSRARELCATVGDDASICPILFGVLLFELTRRVPCKCRDDRQGDPQSGMSDGKYRGCHRRELSLGTSQVHLGTLAHARPHLRTQLRTIAPLPRTRPRASPMNMASRWSAQLCLWRLVYVVARLSGPGIAARR